MTKRNEFFKIADQVAKDDENDPWTKEPWPSWFQNVVVRLARVFIPTLKREDFKTNRERFEGFGLAFVSQLVEQAQKVDTTKFPKNPLCRALKKDLEMIGTVEAEKMQSALKAATTLPPRESAEVFAAYSEGVKSRTVEFALKRIADSQTAQICLFLVFARPWIEAQKVPTVTVLFESFMKIKEAFPGQKKFFEMHPNVRRSLGQHFRKICSLDGVKVAARGQPRRIKTDTIASR